MRRYAARGLDLLAVLVILIAVARFVVMPRLHPSAVPAPPVSLATLEGGRFDLERQRGRLVFLDFWASWCEPCQASIPMVQHFKRSHPGVDVESVDVGEDLKLVRPFVRRYAMRDVALDPDQTVAHAFGVDGFPTLIAIDPSGRVRARWIGYDPNVEREMSEAVTRYAATGRVALARHLP